MARETNCLACEGGDGVCMEHGAVDTEGVLPTDGGPGSPPAPTPSAHEAAITREELNSFRKKVAKSVKRLNRAVKEARRERKEPETGIEPPPEPEAPPVRRMNDAAKLGLGVFRSCKRK